MKKYFLLILILISPSASGAGLNITAECKDQLAHGIYLAKTDQDVTIIEGTYELGKKHGNFSFYNSAGQKTIEIPYTQDKLNGTVQAWFHGEDSEQSNSPKLISDVSFGYIEGNYQTWYPSGVKRSSFVIVDGDIISGELWNEDGSSMDLNAKAEFLQSEIDGDFDYYGQLEQIINTYPPEC